MTEKESKYNEECEADCVVHKLATHNTCVFCSACRKSPYYREDFLGKSDEEKAEEYADYFWGASPSTQRAIKQAYLAGVKAGRPKWHKVADNDYPPCEKGNYTINVLTDCGDIAYYNYDLDCWIAEPASAEIDPPVAWCELPKFEE